MENDILDALEDLGYDGPLLTDGALQKVVQEERINPELMSVCVWLSEQLKQVCNVEETVSEKEEDETFRMEVSGMLKELGCPHSQLSGVDGLVSPQNRLQLLDYLTSELQACRISGGEDSEKMEIDQQAVSPPLQQLMCIVSALDLKQPSQDTSVFDLFSQIETQVQKLLRQVPKDHLGKPLLTKRLNTQQWDKVEQINSQLNSEYTLRRQMLLKRLDVTIKSFGWSDKAKGKKDRIAAAFQPIRRTLPVSAPFGIVDIVAARSDLLAQPRTSSGIIRESTQCAVNKVLIGKVPDRGGRPSTMTPPVEMPFFKSRTEAPRGQRQGGGYGGRGGGRHGKGGQGKVQGGWSAGEGRGGGPQGDWGGRGGGHHGGWSGRGRGGGGGGGIHFGGDRGYSNDRSTIFRS